MKRGHTDNKNYMFDPSFTCFSEFCLLIWSQSEPNKEIWCDYLGPSNGLVTQFHKMKPRPPEILRLRALWALVIQLILPYYLFTLLDLWVEGSKLWFGAATWSGLWVTVGKETYGNGSDWVRGSVADWSLNATWSATSGSGCTELLTGMLFACALFCWMVQ
jgi:hypothetical protein